jgi:hypothetical protein
VAYYKNGVIWDAGLLYALQQALQRCVCKWNGGERRSKNETSLSSWHRPNTNVAPRNTLGSHDEAPQEGSLQPASVEPGRQVDHRRQDLLALFPDFTERDSIRKVPRTNPLLLSFSFHRFQDVHMRFVACSL